MQDNNKGMRILRLICASPMQDLRTIQAYVSKAKFFTGPPRHIPYRMKLLPKNRM